MTFVIEIPGQPPSGNHANKIGRGFRRGGISYPKLVKTPEAEAYQAVAAHVARIAKPKGWVPNTHLLADGYEIGPFVIMEYRFWLHRDADCTNLIKVVEDGVCPALGFNDSLALPRAMLKVVGVTRKMAHTEITIIDDGPF